VAFYPFLYAYARPGEINASFFAARAFMKRRPKTKRMCLSRARIVVVERIFSAARVTPEPKRSSYALFVLTTFAALTAAKDCLGGRARCCRDGRE
jgi:hypothetical protein